MRFFFWATVWGFLFRPGLMSFFIWLLLAAFGGTIGFVIGALMSGGDTFITWLFTAIGASWLVISVIAGLRSKRIAVAVAEKKAKREEMKAARKLDNGIFWRQVTSRVSSLPQRAKKERSVAENSSHVSENEAADPIIGARKSSAEFIWSRTNSLVSRRVRTAKKKL